MPKKNAAPPIKENRASAISKRTGLLCDRMATLPHFGQTMGELAKGSGTASVTAAGAIANLMHFAASHVQSGQHFSAEPLWFSRLAVS